MKKNRKTRLFRSGSLSNRQRDKIHNQTRRYANIVDGTMITLVKALGSSLKEDEYTLIIPDAKASAAKPYERLQITDGENGALVLRVSIDPDLADQVKAFKEEMNQTGTGEGIVQP